MSDQEDLIIAHLSDLHLSSSAALQNFDYVIGELQEIKPHIITVTGDFVDDPRSTDLKEVKLRLNNLREKCGDKCLLALVPGNHDYRWKGNVKFPRLRDWLPWNTQSVNKSPFEANFKEWGKADFFSSPNRPIAIFKVDSNTNDHLLNFARGRVGSEEYKKFDEEYERLKKGNQKDFEKAYKIVLLHHHPLPIAGTERDKELLLEPFMILDDAGTFLGHMVNKGVELILHGHKHCPNFSRIRVLNNELLEKEILVLGAGTATSKDKGPYGNSYNLITVKNDGTIEAERKHLVGTRFQKFWSGTLVNYESYRNQMFETSLKDGGINFQMVADEVSIDNDGDSLCMRRYKGGNLSKGTENGIPFFSEVWPGGKCIFLSAIANNPLCHNPTFEISQDSTDQILKGFLKFDVPLYNMGFSQDYEIHFMTFNAFALTKEQRARMYPEQIDAEYRSISIQWPTKKLIVQTHFGEHIKIEKFSVKVFDQNGDLNFPETDWCNEQLCWFNMSRNLNLEITKPLKGHEYRICWELPKVNDEIENSVPHEVRWKAEKIQRTLLKFDRHTNDSNLNWNLIQTSLLSIRDTYFKSEKDSIEIGIMIFDEETKELKHVIGLFPPVYWEWSFLEGQGIGGRAHKLNRAQLYVRNKTKPHQNYYAVPPSGLLCHESIWSTPLRYPLSGNVVEKNKIVLGVLNIASHDPNSLLCQFFGEENETKRTDLINFWHNQLIPAFEKMA